MENFERNEADFPEQYDDEAQETFSDEEIAYYEDSESNLGETEASDPPAEHALIDALRGFYGNDAERIASEVMRTAAKESEARFGVPYESAEIIAKARVRGGGAVGNMTRDEERVFVRGLIEQEHRIRKKNPNFDLESELRSQPTLRLLLASGEPLERALSYLNLDHHLAEKERETEQRVVSQIRSRKSRPQPISREGTGSLRIDFSRMSDDEMRNIDDRLKRGEKIYV